MSALLGNPLLLTSAPSGDDAYQIKNSIRFDDGDSPYFTRTLAAESNRRTWTWAGWVKKCSFNDQVLFYADNGGTTFFSRIQLSAEGDLALFEYTDSVIKINCKTNHLLRDSGAWYHIVVALDTTQATASERVKMYINGKLQSLGTATYPDQHLETRINALHPHTIGRQDSGSGKYLDSYLTDVYFIDGLALTPASFGKLDSTGVFIPTAFTLPTPNDGTDWSDTTVNSSGGSLEVGPKANLFNGSINESDNGDCQIGSNDGHMTLTTGTFPIKSSLRFHQRGFTSYQDKVHTLQINDDYYYWKLSAENSWFDIPLKRSYDSVTTFKYSFAGAADKINAIEVDGVILVDEKTDSAVRNNPNDGRNWHSEGTESGSSNSANSNSTKLFDGGASQFYASNGNKAKWTHDGSGISYSRLRMMIDQDEDTTTGFEINGTDFTANVTDNISNKWYDVGSWLSGANLTSIEVSSNGSSGNYIAVKKIEVDGHVLIDDSVDQSFHLKFSDASNATSIGFDTLVGDINNPNKGGPILKTKDDSSGRTLDSGTNTDANASSIVLAIPCNSATDVHHTVKGSGSAKTITYTAGATAKTDIFKYYGTSTYVDGSGARVVSSQTNDCTFAGQFTVEGWFYLKGTLNAVIMWSGGTSGDSTGQGRYLLWTPNNTLTLVVYDGVNGTTPTSRIAANQGLLEDTWYHVAVTRDSSNLVTMYLDGVSQGTWASTNFWTGGSGSSMGGQNNTGAPELGSQGGSNNMTGYLQDWRWYTTCKYTNSFQPQTPINFKSNNITTSVSDDGSVTASGTRTDSNASSLVLAVPFNGVLTDRSADVKGSGTNLSSNGTGSTEFTSDPLFYGKAQMFQNTRTTYNSSSFNVGTGAFTFEMWVLPSDMAGQRGILQQTDNNGWNNTYSNGLWAYFHPSGTLNLMLGDGKYYGFTNIASDKWYHIAVTRDSSASLKFFLNGELKNTQANADAANDSLTREYMSVGGYYSDSYRTGNCRYQDMRFYTTCKYTASFTLPHIDKNVTQYAPISSATGALPILNTQAPVWNLDIHADSPTNYGEDEGAGGEVRGNYCTWNPLNKGGNSTALAQGNLKATSGTDSRFSGTMVFPPGKWYWEYTIHHDALQQIGIIDIVKSGDDFTSPGGSSHNGYIWLTGNGGTNDGRLYNNGTASITNWPNGTTGDTVMIAYDADTGKLWIGENGTWFNDSSGNTGNPSTGANPAITVTAALKGQMTPVCGAGGGSDSTNGTANFGARAFKHAAPTDFKCLCTQNFPDTFSGDNVNNPSKYFDVSAYSGTGAANSIKEFDFQPDFLWIKARDGHGYEHLAFDAIRGDNTSIAPSANNAEDSFSVHHNVTSLDSNGFTLAASSNAADLLNQSDKKYAAWAWDAGTAAATPSTAGTINPTDEWVNTDAGFSIIRFTSPDSSDAQTVGHSLGAVPHLILSKNLENTYSWEVWHKDLAAGKSVNLNDSGAQSSGRWGSMTNTTFGTVSGYTHYSTHKYINYLWTEIAGYSKFGIYEGNNSSTEGPFVYTGFLPKFIFMKGIDNARDWPMLDTVRDDNNVNNIKLYPNLNSAESSSTVGQIDVLSNGFRLQSNHVMNNASETYVFMAWADNPFKTARAK